MIYKSIIALLKWMELRLNNIVRRVTTKYAHTYIKPLKMKLIIKWIELVFEIWIVPRREKKRNANKHAHTCTANIDVSEFILKFEIETDDENRKKIPTFSGAMTSTIHITFISTYTLVIKTSLSLYLF